MALASHRIPVTAGMAFRKLRNCLPVVVLLPVVAAVLAADEDTSWFDADTESQAAAVNEGALEFLTDPPAGRVLHTRNELELNRDSLHSGWVQLRQCQTNLDPVPAVEIVYRYRAIRNLRVLSSSGIDSVRVEGEAVEMTNVRPGAGICIAAEVQVLRSVGQGRYELQSGPYHRRFLDGFYPLRLDFRLTWPSGLLVLESVHPPEQPGLGVARQADAVKINALFEGRLTLSIGLRQD